jgi:hypothetical protein
LKLAYNQLLSTFAFDINLRRYSKTAVARYLERANPAAAAIAAAANPAAAATAAAFSPRNPAAFSPVNPAAATAAAAMAAAAPAAMTASPVLHHMAQGPLRDDTRCSICWAGNCRMTPS